MIHATAARRRPDRDEMPIITFISSSLSNDTYYLYSCLAIPIDHDIFINMPFSSSSWVWIKKTLVFLVDTACMAKWSGWAWLKKTLVFFMDIPRQTHLLAFG